jgi:hypothetical protein
MVKIWKYLMALYESFARFLATPVLCKKILDAEN